jgi:hypothetical protein
MLKKIDEKISNIGQYSISKYLPRQPYIIADSPVYGCTDRDSRSISASVNAFYKDN